LTLENFANAFRLSGYEICAGAQREWKFEKVAIYIDRKGQPTHAARQSLFGGWISKLGTNVDIKHKTLELLEGGDLRQRGTDHEAALDDFTRCFGAIFKVKDFQPI
jgi:hypothetical protein